MLRLPEDLDAKINVKIVFPAAMRNREYFTNGNKHFFSCLVMDAKRRAANLRMPFE